ncbi:mycothiol synthase [Tsukamurella sp. 8F]|uniref:mycothiol synthase n=1 Tax=unclassified Tsukamurella TaxID=2633480 RepID=UPI0023B9F149|nr:MULTISPECIES: mycothiol synthase [unclassified Tsukamurella]MDF0528433.1 mycothiol synthase [Tsukamurella sp. 8J]MDF0586258.1 mycothiol synthase [Tsukamurella sp. 8F]
MGDGAVGDGIEVVRGALGGRAASVVEQAAAAARADGVEPLSEQFLMATGGAGIHILAAGGYAGIVTAPGGGPAAVEAFVEPAARGRGLGRALVAAALDAVGDGATVWAHGDLPAARAVAAALGLTVARELLQLRRPLDGLAPVPEPGPGVAVRTYAGPADDAAILAVNNAAFAWHPEQGGWTQDQIAERTGSDWFDPKGLFLAVEAPRPEGGPGREGRVLGFHWTKVHPAEDGEPALGEVYIVGVAPEGQGKGLGRLLTAVGLEYLAERGLNEVELYVEGDNTAALRTYRRLGFSDYRRDVAYGRRR